ncbi:MAG: efflux transporter periplasmic adaptor subunit [Chitinophagaceae bacterium]|nr:efflux transporter periplasmic adaptor subunit [Chitinophagaceae bacterium]
MSANTLTPKLFFSPQLVAALSLFMTIVITGCSAGAKDKNKPETTTVAMKATPVDGTIIKPAVLKEELEITGSLMANQQVDMVSELTRKIVRVNVKEGANVKAGQLLFEMDNADLLAQLDRLRQQEKLALLNEERMSDLIKHEAVVQQDYDQAFTNLKVLQAQIAELKVAISKTLIRAPFGGQIGIVHVYPGAVVSVNTVLANLQDNSSVKVDFAIPEKYAPIITEGSEQSFTVASDAKQYKAKVIARESRLDQNTRTLMVRAISPNPGRALLPGQSARLHLTLHSSNDALMVSSQALIPSSQGYSVYVVKNNRVQLAPVELGQRGPSAVEVLHGLNKGDTVVTSNLLRLIPGTDVQLITLK